MPSPLAISFEPEARAATSMLHLGGDLGFREAAELRRALFEAIDATGDRNLVVDLREVNRIDTAAMAVLVEGLLATKDRGPDLFLIGPNESVRRVFALAGLEDALVRCFDCWGDLELSVAV